jgi:predicted RNA-binding Zn-ribbon protein involved in translation (DUF1610 family)
MDKEKEFNTLDNTHKQIVKAINIINTEKKQILESIDEINNKLNKIQEQIITPENINIKNELLDKKEFLLNKYQIISINYDKMDYYDNTGDLIFNYYTMKDQEENNNKERKNIIDFLCTKNDKIKSIENSKEKIYEKYYKRINGTLLNQENKNRHKRCNECNIEKILELSTSSYVCPCCGDSEYVIFDENTQIKDYSPYKRLNHFREWINQFQAKQSPEIPEQIFIDIVKEINKNRILDLSKLNKKNLKLILKKLGYNIYYEHASFIIHQLNNLPPPKITRDMERIFLSMFLKIQEPWEKYKKPNRKNFLSYSYVLRKFCELLELDHLLEYFQLHKDIDKVLENDILWQKICKELNWEYISTI